VLLLHQHLLLGHHGLLLLLLLHCVSLLLLDCGLLLHGHLLMLLHLHRRSLLLLLMHLHLVIGRWVGLHDCHLHRSARHHHLWSSVDVMLSLHHHHVLLSLHHLSLCVHLLLLHRIGISLHGLRLVLGLVGCGSCLGGHAISLKRLHAVLILNRLLLPLKILDLLGLLGVVTSAVNLCLDHAESTLFLCERVRRVVAVRKVGQTLLVSDVVVSHFFLHFSDDITAWEAGADLIDR
jgi:hypothetical protein